MSIAEKLQTIAENEQKVYNEGHSKGVLEGYSQGEEAGKQSKQEEWWNNIQNNGERTHYASAFTYSRITDDMFTPLHDFNLTQANTMFQNSINLQNLKSALEKTGKKFNTSAITGTGAIQMFQNSSVTHVPTLDLSGATSISYLFGSGSKIEYVEKITLGEKLTTITNAFGSAEKLEHIIFDGVIAISGIDLHWSRKLDLESAKSFLVTLKDLTGTAGENVYTFTFHSDTWDKLDADGATSPTGKTWREYVADKKWVV